MTDQREELRLRCARLVTPGGVLESAVVTVRDSLITEISLGDVGPGLDLPSVGIPAEHEVARRDAPELLEGWTVPGFVDTHVHGGGGSDYATEDPEEARRARRFHLRHGTTTSSASLVTADVDRLCGQIATLVPLVRSGELAGIHLEGPFLSVRKRGAHEVSLLRAPEVALIDRLLQAGEGTISMVTVAPELPGGLAAIERIVAAGVIAAIGHTDGDEQVTRRALDAGATVATHLFNAMRPLHHREPGPVPLLLSDERVTVELICDGVHLHRDVVAMAIAAAGPDRVALVTDAMLAAGAPDGEYLLGRLPVRVTEGTARLVEPQGGPGSIAGSTLTMADAFAFVVDAGFSVPQASTMAARTPARSHHHEGAGEIRVGAPADLCVVDDSGRLQRVLHRGRWVVPD